MDGEDDRQTNIHKLGYDTDYDDQWFICTMIRLAAACLSLRTSDESLVKVDGL